MHCSLYHLEWLALIYYNALTTLLHAPPCQYKYEHTTARQHVPTHVSIYMGWSTNKNIQWVTKYLERMMMAVTQKESGLVALPWLVAVPCCVPDKARAC